MCAAYLNLTMGVMCGASYLSVNDVATITRPVGRGKGEGSSRGFARTPAPFDYQNILDTPFNCTFLSVLPFKSGPLVSLLSRITAVQMSQVTAMRVCSLRTSAEHTRKLFTPLR